MRNLSFALIFFFLISCGKPTDSDQLGGVIITTNTIATQQGDIQVQYLSQSIDTTQCFSLLREAATADAPPTWEQSYATSSNWNVWNWKQFDTLQASQQRPNLILGNSGGAWASLLDGVYYLDSNSKVRIPHQNTLATSELRIALQIYLEDTLVRGQPAMLIQKGNLNESKTPYWGLSIESTGKLKLVLRDSNATVILLSSAPIELHRWSHVELNLAPNKASMSINQKILIDSAWTSALNTSNNREIRIGLDSLNRNQQGIQEYTTINGLLDYIAIQSLTTTAPSSQTNISSSSNSTLSSASSTGTITDSRDGKAYKTVTIGNQTWMAENLNFGTATGSYCYWNDTNNCTLFGRLYTWESALGGMSTSGDPAKGIQGICPIGWHLPSRLEWETLALAIGDSSSAGKAMKGSYTPTEWSNSTWNNGNSSGFGAMPGGFKDDIPPSSLDNGVYKSIGVASYFWSATELSVSQALARGLEEKDTALSLQAVNKTYSLSIRCLKN